MERTKTPTTAPQRARSIRWEWAALTLLLVVAALLPLAAAADETPRLTDLERVSIGSDGTEGNDSSFFVFTTPDGNLVAFESWASNWAPDQPPDETNWVDIFVRDRTTGVTEKITFGYDGLATDEDSFDPTLSADGRYVAFTSYATNLVPGDTNRGDLRDGLDVFVYDRDTDTTHRASLTWEWEEIAGNSVGMLTGNGQYVVFASNGQNVVEGGTPAGTTNIYLRDWQTGAIEIVTPAISGEAPNGYFEGIWASHDGNRIVYASTADNLVPGDDNGVADIFLYDRATQTTTRVSELPGGWDADDRSGQPYLSPDGAYVVFKSFATNLVPGDTNELPDIFLYEVATGDLQRISVAGDGSEANGLSTDPSVCNEGEIVTFTSAAANLVPGDTNGERDAFFYVVATGELGVASMSPAGAWGNGRTHRSFTAPDCSVIAFASEASNLIAEDTNEKRDIFLGYVPNLADLERSALRGPRTALPGERISYTLTLRNDGSVGSAVSLTNPMPDGVSYVPGSGSAGLVYDVNDNQIEWEGTVPAQAETVLTYDVIVDTGIMGWAPIINEATLSSTAGEVTLYAVTIVNADQGTAVFLPLAAKD